MWERLWCFALWWRFFLRWWRETQRPPRRTLPAAQRLGGGLPGPWKAPLPAPVAGGAAGVGAVALVGGAAEGRGRLVLGGEAAVDTGVVDVAEVVAVLGDEPFAGEEGDVIAGGGGVGEVGGLVGDAGGDQVEAAAVLGAGVTGAGAVGLPLVDVLTGPLTLVRGGRRAAGVAVDVGGDELVGGLEEDAVAVGGEVASEEGGEAGSSREGSSAIGIGVQE